MDSWKNLSDGRCVWLSDELGFQGDDGHGRFNCKEEIGYEMKPFSNTQALERLDFMELGFSDEFRKSYSISTDPSGEVFSGGEMSTDSYGNLVSPFCEEKQSGSRFSTDFMQPNSEDLSLVDLNPGSLAEGGGALASEPSPSSVSTLTGKRIRSTALYPRSTYCQVMGCNKDLSSFKGYYKRHKVCDAHTKAAKVIVDGIEQRFCQQCSRFHLLVEFDDGKRSCRTRLAAHNKRRRKPQLDSKPGERTDHNFPAFVKGDIFTVGNPNVDNLSDIKQNSRALSLLSVPSYNTHYGDAINKLSSHADSHAVGHSVGFFRKITEGGFHEPGIYPMEGEQVDPSTIDPRDGSIILDLFQLSSQFQRIEQQRDSTESEA